MNHSTNSRQNRLAVINAHLRTIHNCLREINNLLAGVVELELEDEEE